MRLLSILICVFSIGLYSSAQESLLNSSVFLPNENFEVEKDSVPFADFGITVGVSAFADFEGMYGFNTYVSPQCSLMPINKVQIDVMPYFGRTKFYNLNAWGYDDATTLKFDEAILQFGVYAQATYMITDKWYTGVSVFLDTNIPESNQSPLQGFNNYGTSAYVGYRFTNSFSAEVSFGVSKQPSYYNPSMGFTPIAHPRNPYNRFAQ